jgi:hypothetical protein
MDSRVHILEILFLEGYACLSQQVTQLQDLDQILHHRDTLSIGITFWKRCPAGTSSQENNVGPAHSYLAYFCLPFEFHDVRLAV